MVILINTEELQLKGPSGELNMISLYMVYGMYIYC